MSIYFLDASALAKRYLIENGTNWIREICDPVNAHLIIASQITRDLLAAGKAEGLTVEDPNSYP